MKKILISLFCVLLAMSLLLCGCSSDDDAVTGGDATFELSKKLRDDDLAQLKLFSSDCFYFSGYKMIDGEYQPFEYAVKDGNFSMSAELDGLPISIKFIDSEYHMYIPEFNCAVTFDESLKNMGFDPNEFAVNDGFFVIEDLDSFVLLDTEKAIVDDQKATCKTYQRTSGDIVKTYMNDGALVRVQIEDSDGNIKNAIDIDLLVDIFADSVIKIPSGTTVYKGMTGMLQFAFKYGSELGFSDSE